MSLIMKLRGRARCATITVKKEKCLENNSIYRQPRSFQKHLSSAAAINAQKVSKYYFLSVNKRRYSNDFLVIARNKAYN